MSSNKATVKDQIFDEGRRYLILWISTMEKIAPLATSQGRDAFKEVIITMLSYGPSINYVDGFIGMDDDGKVTIKGNMYPHARDLIQEALDDAPLGTGISEKRIEITKRLLRTAGKPEIYRDWKGEDSIYEWFPFNPEVK